jgi:outer membrane porin protein LC
MKKTLLATAILAGLVSTTAQSVTVYDKDGTTLSVGGRAEVRAEFIDTEYTEENDAGVEETKDGSIDDKSRARINFEGETKISDKLTGFGFVEYEINSDSDFKSRYLYAGFGTEVGKFSYGKQDTANVQISDMTDIASYHSGIQQVFDASSDKQANNFLYSSTFSDAVTIQADYVASSEEDNDSYGVSVLYASDFGVDLGASYSDSNTDQNQVTLGAAYTLNDLYVAVTYAMGDLDEEDDFNSLEAAVEYKFTKEFRMIGIIGQQEQADQDTEDFYALEAQYRFNSALRTYVSYAYNNLDGDDVEDSLLAGIRYNF